MPLNSAAKPFSWLHLGPLTLTSNALAAMEIDAAARLVGDAVTMIEDAVAALADCPALRCLSDVSWYTSVGISRF